MTEKVIKKMIEYFGADVKRINHALKVYGFATTIAHNEQLTQEQILVVELTALLHDIGIKVAEEKYNSCIGKYQELEGPEVARQLLAEFELDADTLNRICFIIGHHHSYQKIDGVDFQIVVEADFLVNIFEDEIAPDAVKSIRKKYFTTTIGSGIMDKMFL